jgi:hypothetical protein
LSEREGPVRLQEVDPAACRKSRHRSLPPLMTQPVELVIDVELEDTP